jgi:ribosomal protein L18
MAVSIDMNFAHTRNVQCENMHVHVFLANNRDAALVGREIGPRAKELCERR